MRVFTDWANYQGVPDAHAIAAAHPEWVGGMLKVSEGHWSNSNPLFDPQLAQLKSAGKAWGAYLFFHPSDFGTSDADTALGRLGDLNPPMGIALDLEVSDGDNPVDIANKTHDNLARLRERFPFRIWLYSAKWFMDPNVAFGPVRDSFAQLAALWVAGYTQSLPLLPQPWTQALAWQFTDNWAGMGMDASYFLGTDKQWQFLSGGGLPAPDPALHAKTILTQQIVGAKVDGIFGLDTHNRVFWLANMRDPAHRANPAAVKLAQAVAGIPQTGHYDKLTHDRVGQKIQTLQRAWGVRQVDGTWNAQTVYAEAVLDPLV